MYRKLERKLESWKDNPERASMLLIGARQTGKTYLLTSFGRSSFGSMIYIDFEKTPRAREIFDDSLDPDILIPQLEVISGKRFIEGDTLIFLDEIQACPRAITSLKYFTDSPRNIHVIGAGSLLGVALERSDFSFPVGKVITERLYPLDFEEFLMALGKDGLLKMCRDSFLAMAAIPSAVHEELVSLYRSYLVVGGMPKAVSTYVESRSYLPVGEVQKGILSDYRNDIAKYADDSAKVLAQRAFDTIPAQLAKENHKFQ